jgi:hypothetical protein
MADTTIATSNKIHWILYPVLAAVVLLLVWLWHDTQVRDAALLQTVASAKVTQATVDKQANATISQTNQDLQKQNADLQASLQKAKTTAQQVALINQQAGTHLQVQPVAPSADHQATNPSQSTQPVVIISPEDVKEIAKQTVDFKEAQNQVGVDQLIIAAKDQQIGARDTTIKAQGQEITTLKGGSHWKRFWTATKHVAVGVVIGIAIDEAVKKK